MIPHSCKHTKGQSLDSTPTRRGDVFDQPMTSKKKRVVECVVPQKNCPQRHLQEFRSLAWRLACGRYEGVEGCHNAGYVWYALQSQEHANRAWQVLTPRASRQEEATKPVVFSGSRVRDGVAGRRHGTVQQRGHTSWQR